MSESYGRTGWFGVGAAILITAFLGYQATKLKFEYDMLSLEPKGMPSVKLYHELLDGFDMSPDYAMARMGSGR